jgi:hypothetical protein
MPLSRFLLVTCLSVLTLGSGWGAEPASLTVTVKEPKENYEWRYSVPGFVEDEVRLPIFFNGKNLILSCTLVQNQAGQVDLVLVSLANPEVILPGVGSANSTQFSGPLTIYQAYFPYVSGQAFVALAGENVLTLTVEGRTAEQPKPEEPKPQEKKTAEKKAK